MTVSIAATAESWPIAETFTISRGSKSRADVVVATVADGAHEGRGECVPYPRYGESIEQTICLIEDFARTLEAPLSRDGLLSALPACAARNALDCALWDLQSRQCGQPVWVLAGMTAPKATITAYTIGLGSVEEMANKAARHAHRPLLKIKLGGSHLGNDAGEDVERLQAVRRSAPNVRLIVDVNEGWSMKTLEIVAPIAAKIGVELIEQPLPASSDEPLGSYDSPVALGADESILADPDLGALAEKYQVVNIKLDKTGGLTHAIRLVERAQTRGLAIMIGCMVATSLSMAPALLLAGRAAFVDLDGPLLLAQDRCDGLRYDDDRVSFPDAGGWGNCRRPAT